MASPDGRIWLALNGEIYNFRELRTELEASGRVFSTTSDTEVALAAYERFGDAFVERLHGMFAIAVFDEARDRVVLARDRLGKKPLYYSERNGRVAYASELKALLARSGIRCEHRSRGARALSDVQERPRTALDLPWRAPASSRTSRRHRKGTLHVRQYWRPKFTGDAHISEEEAAEQIVALLRKATRARMEASDVPIAAFLSGGVDSSLVVALMAEHSTIPVRTFSLGYTERVAHKNDLIFAREIAKRFGTDHHEREISPATMIDDLPKVVRAFDEPFAGTISPYWLCGEISRQVKSRSRVTAPTSFSARTRIIAWPRSLRMFVPARRRATISANGQIVPRFQWLQRANRIAVWRTQLAGFDDATKRELLADRKRMRASSSIGSSAFIATRHRPTS